MDWSELVREPFFALKRNYIQMRPFASGSNKTTNEIYFAMGSYMWSLCTERECPLVRVCPV